MTKLQVLLDIYCQLDIILRHTYFAVFTYYYINKCYTFSCFHFILYNKFCKQNTRTQMAPVLMQNFDGICYMLIYKYVILIKGNLFM